MKKNVSPLNTPELNWESDGVLKIDDVSFIVDNSSLMRSKESKENTFVLGKSKRQLECIQDLQTDTPIRSIFDIGIYKGGSVVFYQKFFNPKKLIAVELSSDPVTTLEGYVKNNQLESIVRTHYGVDQSDADTLHRIVQDEMQGEPLDLIVDDASHFLRETRESFNILFPYLAPGGHYIIEDWGWAHWNAEHWQTNGGPWPDDPPLSNLIFELTMLGASRPDLVDSIFLRPAYAVIRKGYGSCKPRDFNISSSYFNRGKPVSLLS